MVNPELNNSPALVISNVVYGRERREDGRVIYFLDNKSLEGKKVIPEKIVLKRWRKREFVYGVARGFRLSPNFWRAISIALGKDALKIKSLNKNEIEISFTNHQEAIRSNNFKTQSASNVIEVFKSLETFQLQSILDRHTNPDRMDKYGTPDLFLFTSHKATHSISRACFVEVKRHDEVLSNDQINEINFLRNIGLKSRVFRLTER
ncbi:VRR-NUC domain-containing protein [Amylibacter sp.]|nr:VRR-NUC domain-containing protein [Amylibacter sp.]